MNLLRRLNMKINGLVIDGFFWLEFKNHPGFGFLKINKDFLFEIKKSPWSRQFEKINNFDKRSMLFSNEKPKDLQMLYKECCQTEELLLILEGIKSNPSCTCDTSDTDDYDILQMLLNLICHKESLVDYSTYSAIRSVTLGMFIESVNSPEIAWFVNENISMVPIFLDELYKKMTSPEDEHNNNEKRFYFKSLSKSTKNVISVSTHFLRTSPNVLVLKSNYSRIWRHDDYLMLECQKKPRVDVVEMYDVMNQKAYSQKELHVQNMQINLRPRLQIKFIFDLLIYYFCSKDAT